jgi:hypothetical protein
MEYVSWTIEKPIGKSQLFTFKYQFCHIWIPPNLRESLDFGLYLSSITLFSIFPTQWEETKVVLWMHGK